MLVDKIFVKFIIVGVINTIFGSVLIFTLYNACGMSYWLSSGVSYILASVLSFFLNKYFTFAVKKWSFFMVAAFIVNIAVCYAVAYGLAKPAMNYFLQNNSQKLRENVALLAGICLFTVLNYLGQRFVVFRNA
jgi:putative flippase GtrA